MEAINGIYGKEFLRKKFIIAVNNVNNWFSG